MAWDSTNLRTQDGIPVSPTDRDTILDVAGQAIIASDRDPDLVIRAAQRVSRKLHVIDNLRAYATRAVSRALDKAERAEWKRNSHVSSRDMETIADYSQTDKIENEILCRELLDKIEAQDREIFLRRIAGDTFPQIDCVLNLKPRTAERRFRLCKAVLRKVLEGKLISE
jgi:hypothetical protein